MLETLTAPVIEEAAANDGQLDLTGEAGWDGTPVIEATNALEQRIPDVSQYDRFDQIEVKGLGPHIKATSEDGSGRLYTPEEFAAARGGISPRPETSEPPVVEAAAQLPKVERQQPYTKEDLQRVKETAKQHFEHFKPVDGRGGEAHRQALRANREGLKQHLDAFRQQLLEELTSLGLSSEDQLAIDQAVAAERDQAVEQVAYQQFPTPERDDASWREKRRANAETKAGRESVTELLTMSDEKFEQTMRDWERYDADQAYGPALKEDKLYKRKAEHRAATSELARLDAENGGVMAEVSAMPLDRSPEGATQQVLGSYLSTQAEIGQKNPRMQEALQKANVDKAVKSLQESLKAGYLAQGLSEAQAQVKLTENGLALRKWLEAQDGSTDPLADLERYGLQRNKEAMLSARQQKVREYLGPTVLKQVLGNILRGEPNPSAIERINLAAELNRSIDDSGSRRRAGAAAMRNSGRIGSLWGRVVTQLETARNLGRNEGALMKSRLYITAMERGLGDSLVTAWEAIPESEKEKARKKWALGKAGGAAALRKMAAKASSKAAPIVAAGAIKYAGIRG